MLAKGRKRKRSAEVAEPPPGAPSGSLVTLSVSKLHRSLQRGEPSLRRLVLVTNTLRRLQGQVGPAEAACRGVSWGPRVWDSQPGPLPGPQLAASLTPVDQLLLASMDAPAFSAWEYSTSGPGGLSDTLHPSSAQSDEDRLQEPGLEPCLGPLDPEEGSLLEEGLEGIFKDIDTSMYDCDLWLPGSLSQGKEAFSGTEVGGQDLADLDYLLDVLLGAQEL